MLSSRARYALRALLDLAQQDPGGHTLIQDISARQNISLKYLQKILLDLKQAGIVSSRKGPGGGYSLARPPASISVGEVVTLTDGPILQVACALRGEEAECGCPCASSCAIRGALEALGGAIQASLKATSLADLKRSQEGLDAERAKVLDFVI
jgi:Rrf2 family protein